MLTRRRQGIHPWRRILFLWLLIACTSQCCCGYLGVVPFNSKQYSLSSKVNGATVVNARRNNCYHYSNLPFQDRNNRHPVFVGVMKPTNFKRTSKTTITMNSGDDDDNTSNTTKRKTIIGRFGRQIFKWLQQKLKRHSENDSSESNGTNDRDVAMTNKSKNINTGTSDTRDTYFETAGNSTMLEDKQQQQQQDTTSYDHETPIVSEQLQPPKDDGPPTTPNRWATSSESTNLSGKWKPIVTTEFMNEYDQYLQNCSQSVFFRKLILSTLGFTEDEIEQNGRNLTMISKNPAGSWKRTLISSGAIVTAEDDGINSITMATGTDKQQQQHKNEKDGIDTTESSSPTFEPLFVDIIDPDSDHVNVESWWEQEGTVHRSILRGKPRVKGGEFETLRYLESDNMLITESMFHPSPGKNHHNGSFKPGYVKWKFQRVS